MSPTLNYLSLVFLYFTKVKPVFQQGQVDQLKWNFLWSIKICPPRILRRTVILYNTPFYVKNKACCEKSKFLQAELEWKTRQNAWRNSEMLHILCLYNSILINQQKKKLSGKCQYLLFYSIRSPKCFILTELSSRRNFKRRDTIKMCPTFTKQQNNVHLIWCVICKTWVNAYASTYLRCFLSLKIVISLMMVQSELEFIGECMI